MTSTHAPALRRSADSQVIGVVLLIVGGGWLLREAGVPVSWATLLSVALIALGLGMVVTSHLRGTKWLPLTGIALAVVLAATSSISVDTGLLKGGIGSEFVTISSVADIEDDYSLGIGELTLDLSALEFSGEERIRARVGVGELVVIVPADAAISVTADVEAGEATITDRSSGRIIAISDQYEEIGFEKDSERLILDLDVALGSIEVHRAAP